MKRAILYARVSTDDQADKGYSLPSQFEAMRKYAAQQDLEIVAEFQDDYSGATPIEMRPEGRKAYAMLQDGQADAIIAYTIDRFVRPPEDGDEWEMPILIRGLAKLDKQIHTVEDGQLKTDFAGLLIAVLKAKSASEERRKIRERTMRGKRRKVKEGKVVGMRAPYGYRHVRDKDGKVVTLEIVEETARIVRLIYQWYVDGDEHGARLSDRAIALRLTEMGILAPGELHTGIHRKRGKTFWNHAMIGNILTNELYAGTWRYGVETNEQTKRENWESVSVTIAATIDRETWKRVQVRRARNKAMAKRNGKRDYLLRGMMWCGLCGYHYNGNALQLNKDGERARYYRDSRYAVRHVHLEGRCGNKSIRADTIEADIWDEIRELFQDLDKLWDELKSAQQSADDQLQPLREKLQVTDDLIQHEEREAAKIAAALPDTERASMARKLLIERDIEISAHLADLTKQREKIVKELGASKVTEERVETIMSYARRVRQGISKAENSVQAKRRILEALDVQITVTPGKYHLKTIVGEKDGEISRTAYGGMRIVTNSSRWSCRIR